MGKLILIAALDLQNIQNYILQLTKFARCSPLVMGLMWDLRTRPKKPRKILMIFENYDFVNDYHYSLSLLSGTLTLVEFLKKF